MLQKARKLSDYDCLQVISVNFEDYKGHFNLTIWIPNIICLSKSHSSVQERILTNIIKILITGFNLLSLKDKQLSLEHTWKWLLLNEFLCL